MAHLVVDQTASDGDGDTEVDRFSSLAHHRARERYLAHHGGWFPSIKNNNNNHTRSDGGRHAVVVVVEKFGMRHGTKTSDSFSDLGKCERRPMLSCRWSWPLMLTWWGRSVSHYRDVYNNNWENRLLCRCVSTDATAATGGDDRQRQRPVGGRTLRVVGAGVRYYVTLWSFMHWRAINIIISQCNHK
ncbi:unnamed protein product [Macrosiphum euphorbiae]|uniref:Uncharacterized protein n=1 Tax=Macrosiphum euphorbiae TaxID=13131 RepID=A0AAV0WSY9_9HEMI|nr:unnamed protein product [Macrosiphum euphorbiae]